MKKNSSQQSPVKERVSHPTLSRAKCSAYGATAKGNENWTTITDRAERRRVQNRLAQRSYRQRLKDRLQLLERRNIQLPYLTSTSSHSTSLPNMHDQRQGMLLYNDDMQQQYPIHHTLEPLQMPQAFNTEAPEDLALNFPYLSYMNMPAMEFVENDHLSAAQTVWTRPFLKGCLQLQSEPSLDSFTCDSAGRLGTESTGRVPEMGLEDQTE